MKRLKILHVTPTFYPATFYGGPIESTYALCNALAARTDVDLKVLTMDAAGPALSQRIPVPSFPVRYEPGYEVFFCRRQLFDEFSTEFYRRLWAMVGWADVVHLTGTYSLPTIPTLALASLRKRPVLWSPRGALQASHNWSNARRRYVKRIWEGFCRIAMPTRTLLHVTSEAELNASVSRIPSANAIIIRNGTTIPDLSAARQWCPEGVLRLIFLGRIAPVKGIENLIEAVAMLKPGSFTLKLYGGGEPVYVDSLRAAIAKHALIDAVSLHGHIDSLGKQAAFQTADVLILPSFSENFGMAIAESLAYGVPVIATKGTPWSEVEHRGCGRWVENSPKSLASAVEELRVSDLQTMGAAGRAWMESDFDWCRVAALTIDAMNSVAGRCSQVQGID